MGNHLTWQKPLQDSTWTAVHIERATSSSGSYTQIATQTISDSTYFDVNGTSSHWYKIRFFDSSAGVYSDYSTPIQGTIPSDIFSRTLSAVDILGTLGASGPDSDGNFKVFEMKINQNVAEALVRQAYDYTTELIGESAIAQTDSSTVRKVGGFVTSYSALKILGVLNGVAITKHFNYSSGGLNVQKPVVGQMAALMEMYRGETNRWRKLLLTRAIVNTGTYTVPDDLEISIPNEKDEDTGIKLISHDSGSL